MQREKLKNLHMAAFLELHFWFSKATKLKATKFWRCEKDIVWYMTVAEQVTLVPTTRLTLD
jgi:hypothetical protein